MYGLEKFEMIKTTLEGFESSSNNCHSSPDVNEGFGFSGSRDPGIFELDQHEVFLEDTLSSLSY